MSTETFLFSGTPRYELSKEEDAWRQRARKAIYSPRKWIYDELDKQWQKVGHWKVIGRKDGHAIIKEAGKKPFLDRYGVYEIPYVPGINAIGVDARGKVKVALDTKFGGTPARTITIRKKKRKLAEINMQAEIYSTPPIVIRHNSRGWKKTPFAANCYLTTNRTFEISSEVGRLGYTHTEYNTYDELRNYRNYAQTNLIVQTGIGTKASLTEGVTGIIANDTYKNQVITYIMKQTRTYDVSNFGNGTIKVKLYLMTARNEESVTLQQCIDNTDFEHNDIRGSSEIKWADSITYVGTDTHGLTGAYPADQIGFDPWKHRYKVRRNYRRIGEREMVIHPGCSVRFTIVDKGPHMVSDTILRETTNGYCLPGYYRSVRIAINGVDIVANNSTGNTMVSKNAGCACVVETTHLALRAALRMRSISKQINHTLTGSLGNEASAGPDGYGQLPSFVANVQSKINPEEETIQTGSGDGR